MHGVTKSPVRVKKLVATAFLLQLHAAIDESTADSLRVFLPMGSKVRVTNEVICYPLPKGLESGEIVVVLSFDCGSYKVQRGQDVFTISSCNIVGKLVGRENRWEAIIES
ncbi:MAG: hypothetical protein ACXWIU_01755 [Limisphaerales bacterium]